VKCLIRRLPALLLPVLAAVLPAAAADPAPAAIPVAAPVTVFAAASLKNALDDAKAAWEKHSGQIAIVNYAASNALAKQIEQGAPADLFISADLEWMQYLSDKGLTQKSSEHQLLGNTLVLVAPAASGVKLHIAPGFGLAAALGEGRLALCNPAVPAGKYGAAALKALGVWDSVATRTAQAENVRAALALVARGEAPLGIVYATDARAEPGVRVVDSFPEDSHPPIVYPIALLRDSKSPDAPALLEFLMSEQARPAFEKQGFSWLPAAGAARQTSH
jgi:molybdate transport system substrate-binding protein